MENYRKCRGIMENVEKLWTILENVWKITENYEKNMENVEKLREIMENYCLGILYKNLHVFIALLKLYCLG